jgi:hypothetical protein
VSSQVSALYDPWGRSLLQALRRMWLLPLILGLLGGIAGAYVGNAAQPSAEALVRVQAGAVDGQSMTRAVETAAQELDTAQVYGAAVKGTGVSAVDLRARTEIAPVTDSQVLSVTVTAPSIRQAVEETDAIVNAGIKQGSDRRQDELDQITEETRSLISKSKLSNSAAERARVASLGDALATSQAQLIANTRQLTLLSPAASSSTIPNPALLGAMGLVGGALLGLGLAMLLGNRRGTVKSAGELRRLYPHVPIIEQDELGSLLDMENATTSTWVVGGFDREPEHLQPVVEALTFHLSSAGMDVRSNENLSVLHQRRGSRTVATDQVAIVATQVNQAIVRSVEREQEAALLLVVLPQHTRHEWLDQYAAIFGDHTYLVVGELQPDWKW